jgi:hypothetical protein
MKMTRVLAPGVMLLFAACSETMRTTPVPTVGISDRYSRGAVKSYEVFGSDIEGHAVMMVRLARGERFPMVCKRVSGGIYPISQSVFETAGAERWSIMCEPRVRNGYSVMRLELSGADGNLFVRDKRLKRLPTQPLLEEPQQ